MGDSTQDTSFKGVLHTTDMEQEKKTTPSTESREKLIQVTQNSQ